MKMSLVLLIVLAVFAATSDASFYGARYGGLGLYGYNRGYYGAGLYGRSLYGYGAGYYGHGRGFGLYGRRYGFY